MRGGRRTGAGRKKGVPNKRTTEQRALMLKMAKQTGLLPHEILLAVAQGRAIFGRISREDLLLRLDAASKAAPYYAPRLAAVVAKLTDMSNPWEEILQLLGLKSRIGLPRPAKERLGVTIDGTGSRITH